MGSQGRVAGYLFPIVLYVLQSVFGEDIVLKIRTIFKVSEKKEQVRHCEEMGSEVV